MFHILDIQGSLWISEKIFIIYEIEINLIFNVFSMDDATVSCIKR